MKALAAIILAAGKGTRMKSDRAKVTFPIAGKPMIQRVVDSALKLDCQSVCVVVGYQMDSVVACLEDDDRIDFVEQSEQLGTGHAVLMAEQILKDFEGDVLILCGDVPLLSYETLQQLHAEHVATAASCTVLTAFLDDPGKYGRILRDPDGKISGIVEFKDATAAQRAIQEWNTGIYCYDAKELFSALKLTSNQNQQGEYYLTDTLHILHGQCKKVVSVVLKDLTEVSGVNSQQQLAELEDAFIAKVREHWLNNGVVMHNPATIYIDDTVVLQPDVEIGQNTIIKGGSMVDRGAFIGSNCYIDHSKISSESILEGYNILVYAHIPEHHIVELGETYIEE
ncbi:MAG: sugar phosphate nucleotidyltransferase, partial [Candidatus Cloacimonadaceae bacterium]|nr:sugar phosphate nucleotidyltransferase [Candidatus Cloacimonadaceae bacterium]